LIFEIDDAALRKENNFPVKLLSPMNSSPQATVQFYSSILIGIIIRLTSSAIVLSFRRRRSAGPPGATAVAALFAFH
jgi:hypothetical protein